MAETPPAAEGAPRRPSPLARGLRFLVRGYQLTISPLRPPSCRYLPSCSSYAVEALEVHGAVRGSWLALRRLLRCHPFHAGGHDPVPPRVAQTATQPGTQLGTPPGTPRETRPGTPHGTVTVQPADLTAAGRPAA